MKKTLLAITLFLVTSKIFSAGYATYKIGDEIDVANHFDIQILVNEKIKMNGMTITVTSHNDFECNIEFMPDTNGHLLNVQWSAGTDSSGCDIQFTTKDGKDIGTTKLFMNY